MPGPVPFDRPIYLDHNATTPLLPAVLEAMSACWACGAMNPSSQHAFGNRARRLLEAARARIADLLGAEVHGQAADQVILISGGTEANNLALFGLLGEGNGGPRQTAPPGHLIVSAIEHSSVAAAADRLAQRGWQVDRLPVNGEGVVRVDALEDLLRPDTRLVSVMLANNETGVVQPVARIAEVCARRRVPVHTDAAQAVAKVPVHFRELGVAALSFAAHKFHGPIGIGGLVVRHGYPLVPQLFGGFQQSALRPGTEAVPLAVGMQAALDSWSAESNSRGPRMKRLRDRLEAELLAGWPAAVVVGARAERLPHVSNVALVGLDRQALVMALDQAGVACSTGSACASGSSEPSPVLVAMGCDRAVIDSSVRLSLGATTSDADVSQAVERILKVCNRLRSRFRG